MRKLLILLFLPVGMLHAQSGYQSYLTDQTGYREHAIDITRMKVEVSFDAPKGKVSGKVTHSFTVLQQRVDSLFFDAPGITIRSASLGSKPLKYVTDKAGVWVKPEIPLKWDEQGMIVFEYEASPKRGIYFIGWNDTADIDASDPFSVRKQIWTQGQGIDNRHWIPMYDDMNDKFITETVITFDQAYQVLSNGQLLKKSSGNGKTTWHYSMSKPHAGYLLMIAIGKYAVNTTKTSNGVVLNNWYYPEFRERAEPTYRYTADMMNFLEQETGIPYPWESYSQVMVQGFIYGAMENTTATIFGDFFNVDERAFADRNYVGVNCHEMTHQWFGDFVTARDARDAWLQESFATYWPKQFSKVNEGVDEWSWQRRAHQNAAVEAGKKDNYPVRHTMGGSARNYPKGAAVISMLEYVLGDAQWKRALNQYLRLHAYANVETNDLKQAIQDKLGKDMSWFFDEWILRGGEPHYRVRYENLTYADGSRGTEVTIEQIHKTDETVKWFTMPIRIEVHYTDGTSDNVYEKIAKQFEVVKIPNAKGKEIAYVLFDPNSNVLKQVTFVKPFEELGRQATGAEHMLDRYDAVVAMKEIPVEKKRSLLVELLGKEKHYGIRNEIVNQLLNDTDEQVNALLRRIAADSTAKPSTRETVLKGLKTITPEWKQTFINALSDRSYDVVKTAMDRLVQEFRDEQTLKTVFDKTDGIYGMNNAVAIKQLELKVTTAAAVPAFASIGPPSADRLIRYASPAYEFRTRNLAFTGIKALNLCNEKVVHHLFQAMLSNNARLSGPAAQTLDYLAGQAANRQLIIRYFNTRPFPEAELSQLKKQLNYL